MIAEVGHFALVLALMLALAGAVLPHIGIARGDARMMGLADHMALGQLTMVIVAFAALTHAFVTSDFSVALVVANSHTAKPLLYKISGVWGNHEGSLLLWVLILSAFAAAVAWRGRTLPLRFRARALAVQSAIGVGFLLFILFTSNPFLRLDPAAPEGQGLNPLLQDPGLAFHPPMLYLGYVGLSVSFSFAIAALIEGEVTAAWARWVRPWTLTAWIFLTAGITLGSWWAYYELGWGGWWFWDPVENASFMPWLAATALLHSAIVVERRDALKSWTLLLAIVAFSFSLLGTFLVRSGVLTSVHAFASDPARGVFILAFLAVVVGGSLVLYAWRAPSLEGGGLFGLVSRESALVLNNVLLSSFAAVVLVGTLYPIFVEAFADSQITVGPPFFEFASVMLMSPLIVAVGIGPLLAWKRGRLSRALQILLPVLAVALMAGLLLLWRTAGGYVMTAVGFGLAVWLIGAVLADMAATAKLFDAPARAAGRLFRLPRARWGMWLAHGGVGVILLGITFSEAFTSETLTVMAAGDTADVGAYRFRLDGVAPEAGPNYAAVRGTFSVFDGDRLVATLRPEDRVYADPVLSTTEAAIHPRLSGDLYAVIGEAAPALDGTERWSVRLYFKPAISGLWGGTALMVLGGLLSLSDRRLRMGVLAGRKGRPGPSPTAPQGSGPVSRPVRGTA
ncbi:heme lyase CcmF/NrfE family subunit [Eilatimonas milleporae]|uniref:Cytochrome c-type biogenesis protein CcmF n=1 Tax=Eilatimonas milleporae TaxID=911205 RepID=A0A3M0BYE9_9PROT|nr:heme lyase CcmF/NrfE family subunit [Eilatimonas milleporae]RMB02042.1 cytochrome c-type biogenesis protein CcmF [Eilatimonas milleporae]